LGVPMGAVVVVQRVTYLVHPLLYSLSVRDNDVSAKGG